MRRISQCFNTKLAEIYKQAARLNQLNTTVIDYLPHQLKNHFSVGSFHQGYLVLITEDPIWASQLRYFLPELRDTLRKDAGMYQLTSIKINVCADRPLLLNKSKRTAKLMLSHQAKEMILSSSEQCSYGPLKAALENLAK